MKKLIFALMLMLSVVTSCTRQPDGKEFIIDMYQNRLFEDYSFLEKHCSKSLLANLSEQYDYDGQGYAVWKFRSSAQDGPTDEHRITNIEEEADGWYKYTAIDMGIPFAKRIQLSYKDGKYIIEDLADCCRVIAPLPFGLDVTNLQDCTIPAAFSLDDFCWKNGRLRMTVYNKDLYDAVEISLMRIGDTLVYNSERMAVDRIERTHGGIDINGGLDEMGCCLVGYEGGTYVARNWDDHPTYTKLGTVEMALAEDFVIIDCGEFPNDPSDTIRINRKLYIERIKGSRPNFFQLNTLVTIKNGMIAEINRRWIP